MHYRLALLSAIWITLVGTTVLHASAAGAAFQKTEDTVIHNVLIPYIEDVQHIAEHDMMQYLAMKRESGERTVVTDPRQLSSEKDVWNAFVLTNTEGTITYPWTAGIEGQNVKQEAVLLFAFQNAIRGEVSVSKPLIAPGVRRPIVLIAVPVYDRSTRTILGALIGVGDWKKMTAVEEAESDLYGYAELYGGTRLKIASAGTFPLATTVHAAQAGILLRLGKISRFRLLFHSIPAYAPTGAPFAVRRKRRKSLS